MSTVARLTVEGIDERIQAFRVVLDRTTARLVDLDADVTRRLLESSHELHGARPRHGPTWRSGTTTSGRASSRSSASSHTSPRNEDRGGRRHSGSWPG